MIENTKIPLNEQDEIPVDFIPSKEIEVVFTQPNEEEIVYEEDAI
jgi:hypothetical protein